jgi:hypothetical protein
VTRSGLRVGAPVGRKHNSVATNGGLREAGKGRANAGRTHSRRVRQDHAHTYLRLAWGGPQAATAQANTDRYRC